MGFVPFLPSTRHFFYAEESDLCLQFRLRYIETDWMSPSELFYLKITPKGMKSGSLCLICALVNALAIGTCPLSLRVPHPRDPIAERKVEQSSALVLLWPHRQSIMVFN